MAVVRSTEVKTRALPPLVHPLHGAALALWQRQHGQYHAFVQLGRAASTSAGQGAGEHGWPVSTTPVTNVYHFR